MRPAIPLQTWDSPKTASFSVAERSEQRVLASADFRHSGGQRQRVAMVRAIVRDSIAFLFDEPLSKLDAKLRVKMRSEITKLHKRLGETMVCVTHDQTEAMTMADAIVILTGTHIVQMGHPLDLYSDPDSAFVASFIGSP